MVFSRLRPIPSCFYNPARTGAALCALAMVLAGPIAIQPLPAADAPPPALELQPYRVRVEVSFAVRPEMGGAFRKAVLEDLRNGIDRSAASLWQFEIGEDRKARLAGIEPLRRLRAEQVATDYSAADLDKLHLLSIESIGGGFRIAGREWDAATAQLGPLQEQSFPERRDVANRGVNLLRALFRPVATVTQAKGGPVVLRARGGALTPHDASWQPLRKGSLFEAYYRYFNKDQVVERIQQVPWTYLTVEAVELGTSACTVTSGLRSAFSARRRRIDVVALEVTRQVATTRLTLVTRPPERRPLGGVEVEVSADSQPAPADKPAVDAEQPRKFVTDRNGQVWIPAAESFQKPVWLFVRSGQNLLARVPFVPGIRPEQSLELPDDSLRLEVEGQVAQLQSELVDTVAKRAVVAALARKRAKDRGWDDVDNYLKQLTNMPKAPAFAADLSAIRLNGLKTARSRKDKITEVRIQKLCDETATLIKDYLDEDKLKELREEIAELKQIAAEDAAAEAEFKASNKSAEQNSPKPAAPPPPPVVKPGL